MKEKTLFKSFKTSIEAIEGDFNITEQMLENMARVLPILPQVRNMSFYVENYMLRKTVDMRKVMDAGYNIAADFNQRPTEPNLPNKIVVPITYKHCEMRYALEDLLRLVKEQNYEKDFAIEITKDNEYQVE